MTRTTRATCADDTTSCANAPDPFPEPLTRSQATPGTVVTMYCDDLGKLYRIDGFHRGTTDKVDVTDQNGRKVYCRIGDLQLTDRPFPVLPAYVPVPGDFVVTANVRGWKDTDPLFVTKVTATGKATVFRTDGTGRYANVPFRAVRKIDARVTIASAEEDIPDNRLFTGPDGVTHAADPFRPDALRTLCGLDTSAGWKVTLIPAEGSVLPRNTPNACIACIRKEESYNQ